MKEILPNQLTFIRCMHLLKFVEFFFFFFKLWAFIQIGIISLTAQLLNFLVFLHFRLQWYIDSWHMFQPTRSNRSFTHSSFVLYIFTLCLPIYVPLHWKPGLPQIVGHESNCSSETGCASWRGWSQKRCRNKGSVLLCCTWTSIDAQHHAKD